MATFLKKLHMINSSGVEKTAEIYSTIEEVGNNYMYAIVDGQNAYIPLVDINDSSATSGRVQKDGIVYAIASSGVPAYGYKLLTSSGTFTVPSQVTRMKVTCIGGGAGVLVYGGSHDHTDGTYPYTSPHTHYSGGGGASTFLTVTANGAGGNSIYSTCRIDEGENYKNYYPSFSNAVVGNGSIKGTHYQSAGYKSGTAGQSMSNIQGTSFGPYGKGGGGGGDGGNNTAYTITGSSGFKVTGYVTTTPGQVVSYTVGGGGYGYEDEDYHNCESGTSGAILVEWGKGI